jgi:hypothetical protein
MKSNFHHPDDRPKMNGLQDSLNTHGYNGGRMPRPKTASHTPIHSGMLSKTKANGFTFGGDASSRADADPANPLGGAPPGRVFKPVEASFGQRSRTSQHDPNTGAVVLATATADPHNLRYGSHQSFKPTKE